MSIEQAKKELRQELAIEGLLARLVILEETLRTTAERRKSRGASDPDYNRADNAYLRGFDDGAYYAEETAAAFIAQHVARFREEVESPYGGAKDGFGPWGLSMSQVRALWADLGAVLQSEEEGS